MLQTLSFQEVFPLLLKEKFHQRKNKYWSDGHLGRGHNALSFTADKEEETL